MPRKPPQGIVDPGSLTKGEVLEDPETTTVFFDLGDYRFVDKPAGYWKAMSPVAVARLIGQAGKRIQFHLGEHHEFVQTLAKVKRAIPRARWNGILGKLAPGVWISCGGGPPWCPRVLGNGGLAIRNFHRVRALDLRDGVSVSGVLPSQIRRDVQAVFRRAAEAPEPGVILMHHSPEGVIFTTERIPDNCVFRGQSILFAPGSLVQGLRVLGAAGGSGPEELAFRLFPDTVCVYGAYRHNDDADTVIENFALARFDLDCKFPLTKMLDPGNAWRQFVGWINDDLDEDFIRCCVPVSLRKDFRAGMTAAVPHSWASQLFEILNQFPPLFSSDPLCPPIIGGKSPSAPSRLRYSIYSLEGEPAAKNVTRAMTALGVQRAKLAGDTASKRIRTVTVPFRDLVQSRNLVLALSKRFGPVRLTIPHLGLDHFHGSGPHQKDGNGDWFGFGRRNGVIACAHSPKRNKSTRN